MRIGRLDTCHHTPRLRLAALPSTNAGVAEIMGLRRDYGGFIRMRKKGRKEDGNKSLSETDSIVDRNHPYFQPKKPIENSLFLDNWKSDTILIFCLIYSSSSSNASYRREISQQASSPSRNTPAN